MITTSISVLLLLLLLEYLGSTALATFQDILQYYQQCFGLNKILVIRDFSSNNYRPMGENIHP